MKQRTNSLLKWLMYAAIAILFSLIETRLLPAARVQNVSPTFDAALTAAVAILEGPAGGAFYGLACGMLRYLAPGNSELIFMLVYMTGGYTVGMLGDYIFSRSFEAVLLSTLLLSTAATALYTLFMVVMPRRAGLGEAALTGLIEIAMSVFTVPVVYFPARAVARRWHSVEE